jgi:DNA invertase Pin-like site-specific DNA recombinase
MDTSRRVIGYSRVSTHEQADSGAGLAAQRAAIESEASRRGWELVRIEQDAGVSGRSMAGRPALARAIAAIEAGQADALVVAKLDRLSRSLLDFASLMERSRKRGWELVALDLGVDSSTASGEMMAGVLALFAQFERRLIGQRTREALAMKRAGGVRLGRPPSVPEDVVRRIVAARRAGRTLTAIAQDLTREGVATAQGGRRWWPATVRAIQLAAERSEAVAAA